MKWIIALWLLFDATPADAAPVFAAIGSAIGAVGAVLKGSVLLQFLAKTALSIGLSALARARAGKQRAPGITTEVTTSGGITSQKIILGKFATSGQWIAPPNSYGAVGGTPRAYLVYAIALSAAPGVSLSRVIVNDAYVTLAAAGATWGKPVEGDLNGYAWIDFRDGTQTAAHADLLAAFGTDPDRPWSADMIGPGTAYLIGRFGYNRQLFNGLVSITAELLGIPLYDPRADSTVGGSGAQRWSDRATWVTTMNPVVMIYNIMRGIQMPDGDVWGGECLAEDLPFSNWAAAMNECDLAVPAASGGTEPQFRAGIEIAVAEDEPIDIIRELLKTCSGQMCEIGGTWKIRVGPVGMPIFAVYDGDVVVTSDEEYTPFPGIAATWNGISATYPEPESLWQAKDAPPRFNAEWEAEDGGRRLVADLQLPACPFDGQVQRVMQAYAKDERRNRRLRRVLPPEAAVLEPLDAVAVTSGVYGYSAKVFEITGIADQLMTLRQNVNMRERDPADYEVNPGNYLPVSRPPVTLTPAAAQAVPGWSLVAEAVLDAADGPRRPAIRAFWTAAAAEDARGIAWELRYPGKPTHLTGNSASVGDGTILLTEGLLPDTDYQGRARFIVDRKTVWSAWVSVHTQDVRLGVADMDDGAAPAVPTGLALSSALAGGKVTLTATWAAVSGSNIRYDVQIRQGAGNTVPTAAPGLRYAWDVLPNTAYTVAVRAVNRLGVASAWSAEVSHTSTRDTAPPAVPAGLAVTAGFETLWLKWTPNTEVDLASYEVFESSTTTPAPTAGSTASYVTPADTLVVTGLADGVTRHYWLRAIDTSGNKSAWSARVAGTTAALAAADISGILQSASYAAGLVPPIVVSTLPTTGNFAGRLAVLTTDYKLYRHDGSDWTAAVPATDVTGQLTNTQLEAIAATKVTGQIASSQIADAAVTTAKFAAGLRPVEILSALPSTGNFAGRTVFLTTDSKTYRHTGTVWTAAVPAVDVTGQLTDAQIAAVGAAKLTGQIVSTQIADAAITAAKFASGIEPVEIVSTLPTTGNFAGRIAFLTSDDKLYRHTGTAWTAAVPAVDVTGQLTDAQIAAVGAAKLTGQIVSTQVTDNAISTPKLAAGAVAAEKIAAGAVVADKIAANAVTAAKIAAGAVEADKIAANAVTAGKIEAGAVVAGKIAAGAVSATEIAAGAVTATKLSVGDFTNYAGHSNFTDETYFSAPAGTSYIDGDASWGSDRLLRLAGAAASYVIAGGRIFEVTPGASFFLSYKATIAAGSGNCWIDLMLSESPIFSAPIFRTLGTVTATAITQMQGSLLSVPAGYKYARLRAIKGNNGTTECLFGDLVLRRMNEGSLIVDGSIIAEKIATNAVVATKISADAVTADKIAANAVTAAKIAADAVTAGKIAANAVTAGKIEANAIIAGKIAAGAVSAVEIAAKAIVASKLAIGDATNAFTDYDMADAAFYSSDGAAFSLGAVSNAAVGDKELRLAENGEAYTGWCSIDAGGELRVRAVTRNVTADAQRIGTVFIEFGTYASGVITPTRREQVHQRSNSVAFNANEVDLIAASNEARFRFVLVRSGTSTGSSVTMAGLRVRKRMAGELIVDGAITAGKILAGAVETDKLAANAVVADKIATDAITAAKIQADAITTAKIAANAITAAKIAANTITAAEIAAGAIGADQIAARAIVTSKLAIGDLTNLILNSELLTAEGWSLDASITVADAPAGMVRARAFEIAIVAVNRFARFGMIVDPGARYFMSCEARVTTAGSFAVRTGVIWFDAAGAQISAPGGTAATLTTTTPTLVTAEYLAPAGAVRAEFRVGRTGTGTEVGTGHIGSPMVRRMNGGELIVDGAITAGKVTTGELLTLSAQIKDAIITDAKIANLSAAKLTAGTALASTITVNGTTLDLVEGRAADPAARVNLGTTRIDPGKILISGTTTLADWRMGGDETRIDGGDISANTVSANKLTIGNRMVTLTATQFEHNSPATNRVSWTAGNIRWSNDAGGVTNTAIVASSANINGSTVAGDIVTATTWTAGILYVYWTKGEAFLRTTTTQATAFGADNIVLAAYGGGKNLTTNYGQTVIDGSNIKTGTVTAAKVDTTDFGASGLAVFGGELKSTGFVTGSTGWRITQGGAAEFNSLVVREDMIVDGAASAMAWICGLYGSIPSSVSLATATQIDAVVNFSPTAPIYSIPPSSGLLMNPVMVEFWADFRPITTSSPAGALAIMLQYRANSGAAWSNAVSHSFRFPANSGRQENVSKIKVCAPIGAGGSAVGPLLAGQYRAVAYRDVPNFATCPDVFVEEIMVKMFQRKR